MASAGLLAPTPEDETEASGPAVVTQTQMRPELGGVCPQDIFPDAQIRPAASVAAQGVSSSPVIARTIFENAAETGFDSCPCLIHRRNLFLTRERKE
jgi:hypothetical protein